MALFSIHCTTCRARLKVRDTAAIGQILACPKCGSMVQVLPPEGWTPGDEAAESSASQSSAAQSSSGQSSSGQSSFWQSSSSPSSSQRLDAVRPGAGATTSGRWKDEVPAGSRTQDAAETLDDHVAAQAPAAGTSAVWLKWGMWAGLPTMAICAALGAWHWSSRLPQPQQEPVAAAEKVEAAPANVPSP
ncbi:MAG TPA: hypothetical protein VHB99_18785, partial [Pirellulales bacterium]|nr:hypothetical protein [Pirellulales bacterium]